MLNFIQPANAFINIGYILVSIFWLRKLSLPAEKSNIPAEQRPIFLIFALMCGFYAPIQFMRITTQER